MMKFKNNRGWQITAAGKSAEILIYEQIGQDLFDDGVGAKEFAEKLNALKVDDITVRINSPGGLVFEGVAIYNSLLKHPAQIHVEIDGIALSAASMVAMAGDTITIAENGIMMIHDPWSMVVGTVRDFQKEIEALDRVKSGLVTAYQRKMTVPQEEIEAMMERETWFTAAEAVAAGLADGMTAPNKVAAMFDLKRYGYKNNPLTKIVMLNNNPDMADREPTVPVSVLKLKEKIAEAK